MMFVVVLVKSWCCLFVVEVGDVSRFFSVKIIVKKRVVMKLLSNLLMMRWDLMFLRCLSVMGVSVMVKKLK